MRHRDDQAARGHVADGDHVARGALARHREALEAHAQPRGTEALGDALVRPALGARGGRAGPARASDTAKACASAAEGGAAAASVQQPATRAGSTRRSLRTRLFRARRRASLVTSGAGSRPRQSRRRSPELEEDELEVVAGHRRRNGADAAGPGASLRVGAVRRGLGQGDDDDGDPDDVREPIVDSWRRSFAAGIDPTGHQLAPVVADEDETQHALGGAPARPRRAADPRVPRRDGRERRPPRRHHRRRRRAAERRGQRGPAPAARPTT